MLRWLLPGFVFLPAACGGEGNPLAGTERRAGRTGQCRRSRRGGGGDPTAGFATAADMTGCTGCHSYAARYRARESDLRPDDLMWKGAGPAAGHHPGEQAGGVPGRDRGRHQRQGGVRACRRERGQQRGGGPDLHRGGVAAKAHAARPGTVSMSMDARPGQEFR